MKRTFMLLLACACLAGALLGCAAQPEKSLYEHGMELIETMAGMARSEAYLAITAGSQELAAQLQPVQEGRLGEPAAVYAVTLGEEYLDMMVQVSEIQELPADIRAVVRQKLTGAFATQINALGGAQKLAAASICAAAKTFVDDSLEESVTYLYVFEDCPPAAVTFVPGEGGAVAASGLFILHDGVDWLDEAALRVLFIEMGAELAALEGR